MHRTGNPRSRMQRSVRPLFLLLSSLITWVAASAAGEGELPAPFGFTAQEAPHQQALEQRFDGDLNPADLRTWLKNLSSEANHVGSPHDKANAEFVRDLSRHWG